MSGLGKVIIFDWDDTLCPSSFVDQWKIENHTDLPLHYRNLFKEIGKCAARCLEAASKYGEVLIITNSDDGWVHFSAERFIPNLLPALAKYRIVSARTRYERFYPSQPLCWKAAAFAHEVNEIYSATIETPAIPGRRARFGSSDSDPLNVSSDSLVSTDDSSDGSASSLCEGTTPSNSTTNVQHSRREIISFGDSMEERTAVKIVSGQLSSMPKSVMFLTSPTPLQIIGQLTMLTGHMGFVCDHELSLDLEISPHQAHKCAEMYLEGSKSAASSGGSSEQEQHRNLPGSSLFFPRIRQERTGAREAGQLPRAD